LYAVHQIDKFKALYAQENHQSNPDYIFEHIGEQKASFVVIFQTHVFKLLP
jgi:hypothetical protein